MATITVTSIAQYAEEAMRFAYYPSVYHKDGDPLPVYPAMAMLGEVGEACEKEVNNEPTTAIVKELGDVLWYATASARDFRVALVDVMFGHDTFATYDATFTHFFPLHAIDMPPRALLPRALLVLTASCGVFAEQNVKKPWRDGSPISRTSALDRLRTIVFGIARAANRCHSTMQEVAQLNIDKLTARRERGTLKGSGDDR